MKNEKINKKTFVVVADNEGLDFVPCDFPLQVWPMGFAEFVVANRRRARHRACTTLHTLRMGLRGMMFGFITRNPRYAAQNVRNLAAVRKAMQQCEQAANGCEYCGGKKSIEPHHVQTVHLHPELAAVLSNLIALCHDCHFTLAHLRNYKKSNPYIREICARYGLNALSLCKGWIEIDPREIGRTWIVPETFTIAAPCGEKLTVPKGERNDRYTFIWNFKDHKPADGHDHAYRTKKWDSGRPITRKDADDMLCAEMKKSWDKSARRWATVCWLVVRSPLGWLSWWRNGR